MSILSFEFLIFVSAALLVTYFLPLKIRPMGLLAASAVFIVYAGWHSAAYLSAIALLTWLGGLGLTALRGRAVYRRRLLVLLLVLDFGMMALMKYSSNLDELLQTMLKNEYRLFPEWLPGSVLGVSYFTFQSAGLLVDIYWDRVEIPRNPMKTWLFLGYFPQLAQGPISTWKELGSQLFTGHMLEPVQLTAGFQLMLWGFFKKLVIADRMAPITAAMLTDEPLPGYLAAGGLVCYAVRLYADFSGGMDVVRGISRMFGVELPENFRRPFFSQSVAEYWRRWHITLGGWFRTYLMYPLTTGRAGIALGRSASKLFGKKAGRMVPTALATLLVFLLIGLWHTANWNAVAYGGYFGVLMAAAMLLDPAVKKLNRALRLPKRGWMTPVRLVRTWLLIAAAQAFAFTASPRQGLSILRQVFGSWRLSGFADNMTAIMAGREWVILSIALSVLLMVDLLCERKKDFCVCLAASPVWVRWPILLLLMLTILIFGVYGAGFDGTAFVYAQF